MNKDIYQTPLAIHAITTVEKHLMKIDAGIQFSFLSLFLGTVVLLSLLVVLSQCARCT